MSITEELTKLETTDASLSQRLVQSWKRKLNVSREPELLSELIDYQLSTQSKPALRILLGTKDLYSHDFFAKINDCLHRQSTCLQSLRLLSHMLIGQTSWLYKIVHSAAFPTLLKLLRPTHSISIITSSVYLLCALIPLNPYHVTPHLPDIFESFTLLATLNCGGENKDHKVSEEVLLSVRVAVYFLFLQLYSLYPCSFVQYLKGRFGPTGEVHIYQEYIAPLFQYVQLHPNLIVELPSQETQRTKWSSKDPSEIATLSLSLSVDPCLVSKNEDYESLSCKNTSTLRGECSSSMLQLPSDQRYCGALSSNELSEMSSPSLVFTQVAPPPSNTPGSQSSHTSLPVLPLATPTATPTSISEPVSLDNSVQNTPLLKMRQSPLFNYSPTASIEPDALSLANNDTQDERGVVERGVAAGRGSSTNTPSSRRQSFSNSSSTVVAKSFSEKLSGIFRRKSSLEDEEVEEKGVEVKEEFANISVSECDQCNRGVQGGAYFDSLSQSPTPPREEERRRTDCTNSLNLQSVSNSAQPFSPPVVHVSCPSVEETVLLASQKLQKIADSQESPQKVSNQDKEGFPLASINNTSTSPQLVARTVLKEKRENVLNCSASILTHSSSPLEALDVFIQTGLVLHKSNSSKSDGLSLSDLEAMDWDHFGCCPHVEELRVLSQLLSSLHSQVLFERYQCQSHAKRNRRLMSKARHVNKLENEIVTLRHRLHQQEDIIRCLKREVEGKKETKVGDKGREVNRLLKEREGLHEKIKRLQQQVMQLEAKNNELSQSLQRSQEEEFASKTKIDELKTKLSIGDNLKTELESLTKEHLLLEELYHQQKLSLSTLRRENVHTQQTKELNESLVREKEGASNSVSVLRREVAKLQMLLKDRETDIKNKEGQIATLKESLWKAQEKYVEKTKGLESKYQCIKNINQELEESLFSFKNRPVHRSRHHKRSESSHLSHSVTPTNTGNITPTM